MMNRKFRFASEYPNAKSASLATIDGPAEPNPRRTIVWKTSRFSLVRAAVAACIVVAGLGLLAGGMSRSVVSRSDFSKAVATDTGRGSAAVAPAATMDIVPSSVIDAHVASFVGTGDGANGSWIQP